MGQYAKVGLIVIGWILLICVTVMIVLPIAFTFEDPVLKDMPLDAIIPALIMMLAVGVPITSFLMTPLLFATIEVFDKE